MTSQKFAGHEQAKARVEFYDDGSMALVSYSTMVIFVDNDGWLQVNGLYSRTTIRHIRWFMECLRLSYQCAKDLYNDNMIMNIHTGEVKTRG